jgi:hypothetical protein
LKESDTRSLEAAGVETAAGARAGVETEREVGVMVAAAREVGETATAEAGAVKESMKCPK